LKYTQNYNLKKPEGTDLVNIDDLNYNADVIDTELAKRIINAGNVPSIQAGLDGNKPAPGTVGRLYVATDTQILYRDTGTAWQKVGVVKWGDIEGKPSSFTPTAHKTTHATGGSDALIPADIGAAVNVVYTATIQAANWSESEAPFSQSVSVSGILSTDTPIIDVVMSGTYGTDIERSSQWNYVYRAVTGANSITFYAKTKPTIDLPIQIKVVR